MLLLDHLIRPQQERRRDRESEGLGGPEVDHQLELRRLLDRELSGIGALQEFVYEKGRTSVELGKVRAVRDKDSGFRELRRLWIVG
jgi:hypothetical protein